MTLPAAETYVVSGNLISITPSVTNRTVVEDVTNSNLLCQLAADKKLSSRFVDPAAWLDFYRNSLGKVFWQITNSNTVSYPVPAVARSITLIKVLEGTFFKALDAEHVANIKKSIGLYTDLPETSAPSLLYNSRVHVEIDPDSKWETPPSIMSAINLQVSVVHDESRLSVCSIYFKTTDSVTPDIFNQKFAVKALSGNVSVSSFKAELLESNYAGIRQQIIDKLGEAKIQENILLIPASVSPPQIKADVRAGEVVDRLEI